MVTLRSIIKNKNLVPGWISKPIPYNLYFNKMYEKVENGWVMFLHDDDQLMKKDSVSTIVKHISDEDEMLFWRVQFPGALVLPKYIHFGKRPVCGNLTAIGFMFHSKYKDDAKWDNYSIGDYRVADALYDKIPNKVHINKVLTGLQRSNSGGLGQRDDLPK